MSTRPQPPRGREDAQPRSMAEVVVILAGILAAVLIGIAQTGRLPT